MRKTLFRIPNMDCAAEESLVRMKLERVASIQRLHFDLAGRSLAVYHDGHPEPLERALAELDLGSQLIGTTEVDGVGEITEKTSQETGQRKLLWTVFAINFIFFVVESTAGLVSGSMGLVADSLDMLADALVYGLSLMAVGGPLSRKKAVAKGSGYLQLGLAVLGVVEVFRRFAAVEEPPDFRSMILVSGLALGANSLSLYLLHRSRSPEVHLRATMIFTSNDIIINLGVILAGVLVAWLDSSLPDLVIGAAVFVIVSRGAFRILKLAG